MKKVIKKGTNQFKTACTFCGCEFSYEAEDVITNYNSYSVDCPECNHSCPHNDQTKHSKTTTQTSKSTDEISKK